MNVTLRFLGGEWVKKKVKSSLLACKSKRSTVREING